MTYKELKKTDEINTYIEQGNLVLGALGYTEHSRIHASKVASTAGKILKELGYDAHQIELAKMAGYLHDMGNSINREDHAHTGALMAFQLLREMKMDPADIAVIITAIGNHDEKTGAAVDPVSAAVILADKTDVRRNRVRNKIKATFDKHDRVNYAATSSSLEINPDKEADFSEHRAGRADLLHHGLLRNIPPADADVPPGCGNPGAEIPGNGKRTQGRVTFDFIQAQGRATILYVQGRATILYCQAVQNGIKLGYYRILPRGGKSAVKLLSVIVPCFNEEQALPLFYQELTRVLAGIKNYRFELIFVDDGSRDRTLDILKELAGGDRRVRYLSFSRNFGKEAAIYAGLEHSTGDYVVLMDADLQDPPSLLPDMLRALDTEGYDSAATRRVTRQGEPPVRSFFARLFYKLINRISDVEIMDGARDYRMMTRKMTNAVPRSEGIQPLFQGHLRMGGLPDQMVCLREPEPGGRRDKMVLLEAAGLFHRGHHRFQHRSPVHRHIRGAALLRAGFRHDPLHCNQDASVRRSVGGWPSLTCIVLLVGGVQLFCTGIIGKYLSKTYLETKNRPKYILREDNLEAADHNSNRKESCHA